MNTNDDEKFFSEPVSNNKNQNDSIFKIIVQIIQAIFELVGIVGISFFLFFPYSKVVNVKNSVGSVYGTVDVLLYNPITKISAVAVEYELAQDNTYVIIEKASGTPKFTTILGKEYILLGDTSNGVSNDSSVKIQQSSVEIFLHWLINETGTNVTLTPHR